MPVPERRAAPDTGRPLRHRAVGAGAARLPPGQEAVVWHSEPGYLGLDTYDVLAQHVVSHHFRFDGSSEPSCSAARTATSGRPSWTYDASPASSWRAGTRLVGDRLHRRVALARVGLPPHAYRRLTPGSPGTCTCTVGTTAMPGAPRRLRAVQLHRWWGQAVTLDDVGARAEKRTQPVAVRPGLCQASSGRAGAAPQGHEVCRAPRKNRSKPAGLMISIIRAGTSRRSTSRGPRRAAW